MTLKLSDVKVGDVLTLGDEFIFIPSGHYRVHDSGLGLHIVHNSVGVCFLDGLVDEDGETLTGFTKEVI